MPDPQQNLQVRWSAPAEPEQSSLACSAHCTRREQIQPKPSLKRCLFATLILCNFQFFYSSQYLRSDYKMWTLDSKKPFSVYRHKVAQSTKEFSEAFCAFVLLCLHWSCLNSNFFSAYLRVPLRLCGKCTRTAEERRVNQTLL